MVERRNMTVMAMARSLLNSMNVPGRFWGEAVWHTVYLLNRLSTKALDECTPFKIGFSRCSQEQTVYKRGSGLAGVIVKVYVDDLIVTGKSPEEIMRFKQQMMSEFEMTSLELLNYYLKIEVAQEDGRITIKQTTYAKKVLGQFSMLDCNPIKFPMEQRAQLHRDPDGQSVDAIEYRRIIGCLRVASRFMKKPTVMHRKAVKQILRYLKGTVHYGLVYTRGGTEEVITRYTDSDLIGDMDDRKLSNGGGMPSTVA
ncbi:uncharacterized mitochondrial protein AtMg00810-like [Phragmites australis]|uniref:uncharacterized mitochondrial protein AtMg00810-like n=1 Tax=Phragmites australis TaxID=29695 RepID=UPI002D7A07B3|nr:uncharacterized mitochondrial protein AtMg00810-like [Phragmites australis]